MLFTLTVFSKPTNESGYPFSFVGSKSSVDWKKIYGW